MELTFVFDSVLSCKSITYPKISRRDVRPYLLTPWSREFLEKLTGFKPINKLPACYAT